ncbi:MAG: hypothetical protein RIS85_1519 [Pseudomonadota bacterium]
MTRSMGTPCAADALATRPPVRWLAAIVQTATANHPCAAFTAAIFRHGFCPAPSGDAPAVPEVSGWGTPYDRPVSPLPASPQKLNVYACDVLESDSMSTGQPGTKPVHRYIRNGISACFDLSGTIRRSIRNAEPIHREQSLDTPGTQVNGESPRNNESRPILPA